MAGSPMPPRARAGEGDAELDGGEELVDVVFEAESGAGAGAVELDEGFDAGFADADEANSAATKKLFARMKKAIRLP